jgi:hypothetical protein
MLYKPLYQKVGGEQLLQEFKIETNWLKKGHFVVVLWLVIYGSCCFKIYSQCIVEIISGSTMHLKSIIGQLENESKKNLVTI